MKREGPGIAMAVMAAVLALPAFGQEAEPADAIEPQLADLYAIVVGTQATTRCAVFDDTMTYLTPLEATAAEYRLRQMETALAGPIENIADVVANMRAEAAQIPCGSESLEPFLDFNRGLAHDLVDVALLAWQEIDIAECNYFADDDFMASVAQAEDMAENLEITGTPARIAYVERTAAGWVATFEENCRSLAFDPTRTLPGLVALALPAEP
ncbi:hypothetical protein [Pelagibacterium xiamenense]|uniref:hypothetical protein n=1 Tax=Pelagibacterium xiamenense TaxID=2901140 RepID=UPI001E60711A|nr:hypothetical protein [Pelagibacterium xiamenense]MCD7060760.1 hypothetical protein [Pelagibacterium xiamenense]